MKITIVPKEMRLGNWVLDPFTHKPFQWYEENYFDCANTTFYPIKLTPEILEKAGCKVDIWSILELEKASIGENGVHHLSIGRTSTPDGLPYVVMLIQGTEEGFTIRDAAAIQKENNNFNDEAFLLKVPQKVFLGNIYFVHQLQNLAFVLTEKELEIKLQENMTEKDLEDYKSLQEFIKSCPPQISKKDIEDYEKLKEFVKNYVPPIPDESFERDWEEWDRKEKIRAKEGLVELMQIAAKILSQE